MWCSARTKTVDADIDRAENKPGSGEVSDDWKIGISGNSRENGNIVGAVGGGYACYGYPCLFGSGI